MTVPLFRLLDSASMAKDIRAAQSTSNAPTTHGSEARRAEISRGLDGCRILRNCLMQLDVRYKDVTFETLNREDFLDAIKEAFPHVDWDKAYNEFRAAGEKA
jgi:hypothetical protein